MADKIIRNTKLDTLLSKLATKLTSIFWRKAETIQVTIDTTPTADSNNLVTSGGVKTYVDNHTPTVPVSDVTVDNVSVVNNGVAEIPAIPTDAVKTSVQSLTDAQKMQARNNLDLYCDKAGTVTVEFDSSGTFKIYPGSSSTQGWYKASNTPIAKTAIVGGSYSKLPNGGGQGTEYQISASDIVDGLNAYVVYEDPDYQMGPYIIVALEDGAQADGASGLSAGVWLYNSNDSAIDAYVEWVEYEGTVTEQIPSKYVPIPVEDVQIGNVSVVTSKIAHIPAPLDNYARVNGGSITEWNKEYASGSTSPSITLPALPVSLTTANEIRYIFEAGSANATFTAPSGVILGDADGFAGLSAGNSLAYTDLVTGSIYECSFVVLDSTHISLIMKEHVMA